MTQRAARVAREMQRQLMGILRDEIKDPRVGFITITKVDMTPDLRYARIFFTILGGAVQVKSAMAGLEKATAYIRYLIAQRMDFRFVPEIVFKFDAGPQYSLQVEEALRRIQEEKDE